MADFEFAAGPPQMPTAQDLERGDGYSFTVHRHVIKELDWQVSLCPEYWANSPVLNKLTPGNFVICTTPDFSVVFELLVRAVTVQSRYIDFAARPLFPHGLELPDVQAMPRPRYTCAHGSRGFDVHDNTLQMPISQNMERAEAEDRCFQLNLADARARAAADRDATVRAQGEQRRRSRSGASDRAEQLAALGGA